MDNNENLGATQIDTELESQKKLNFIDEQLENKNFEERCDFIKTFKNIADELYYKKKFEEASKKYLEALMGLKKQCMFEDEYNTMVNEYQIPILLNLSTVYLENKEYQRCFGILGELKKIERTKTNPKLYYKYCVYYERLESLDNALEYIEKSIDLDPLNIKFQEKKDQILLTKKLKLENERKLFKNLSKYKPPKEEKIIEKKENKKDNKKENKIENKKEKKNIIELIIYFFKLIKVFIYSFFSKLMGFTIKYKVN